MTRAEVILDLWHCVAADGTFRKNPHHNLARGQRLSHQMYEIEPSRHRTFNVSPQPVQVVILESAVRVDFLEHVLVDQIVNDVLFEARSEERRQTHDCDARKMRGDLTLESKAMGAVRVIVTRIAVERFVGPGNERQYVYCGNQNNMRSAHSAQWE